MWKKNPQEEKRVLQSQLTMLQTAEIRCRCPGRGWRKKGEKRHEETLTVFQGRPQLAEARESARGIHQLHKDSQNRWRRISICRERKEAVSLDVHFRNLHHIALY